ncbi:MAG: hypothetical protein WBP13_07210 [Methylophilaceae bacterium]
MIAAIPFIVLAFVFLVLIINTLNARLREKHIREASIPPDLVLKIQKKYPNLARKDALLVVSALRQFFLAYHQSRYQYVSMPSEIVDDLWHEFILYTREYEQFCKKAFGRFFHHTPAVMLSDNQSSNIGLRRTWYQVCRQEMINPKNPSRLPLLFAIDGKLNIEDGRRYALNCGDDSHLNGGSTCCVGDFSNGSSGCTGGDGSDSGLSDSGSDNGGDSSGCGGGCGGD